jgi:hypothetical protein
MPGQGVFGRAIVVLALVDERLPGALCRSLGSAGCSAVWVCLAGRSRGGRWFVQGFCPSRPRKCCVEIGASPLARCRVVARSMPNAARGRRRDRGPQASGQRPAVAAGSSQVEVRRDWPVARSESVETWPILARGSTSRSHGRVLSGGCRGARRGAPAVVQIEDWMTVVMARLASRMSRLAVVDGRELFCDRG